MESKKFILDSPFLISRNSWHTLKRYIFAMANGQHWLGHWWQGSLVGIKVAITWQFPVWKIFLKRTFEESHWNKQHHIVDQLFLSIYVYAKLYSHQMLNCNTMDTIVRACKTTFSISLRKASCMLRPSKGLNLFFSSTIRVHLTQI